jgi:hypothetical protein
VEKFKKTAPAAENQNSSHIGGVLFNKCLLDIKRRQSRKAKKRKILIIQIFSAKKESEQERVKE